MMNIVGRKFTVKRCVCMHCLSGGRTFYSCKGRYIGRVLVVSREFDDVCTWKGVPVHVYSNYETSGYYLMDEIELVEPQCVGEIEPSDVPGISHYMRLIQ